MEANSLPNRGLERWLAHTLWLLTCHPAPQEAIKKWSKSVSTACGGNQGMVDQELWAELEVREGMGLDKTKGVFLRSEWENYMRGMSSASLLWEVWELREAWAATADRRTILRGKQEPYWLGSSQARVAQGVIRLGRWACGSDHGQCWEENIVVIVLKKTVREKQGQGSSNDLCTTSYVLWAERSTEHGSPEPLLLGSQSYVCPELGDSKRSGLLVLKPRGVPGTGGKIVTP